ncbi:MAG: hypothetical protein OEU92_19360 [Alphaproteobacteria bacterium]|nr:hypothetical protein [Alphaproteobacteria bacterium]
MSVAEALLAGSGQYIFARQQSGVKPTCPNSHWEARPVKVSRTPVIDELDAFSAVGVRETFTTMLGSALAHSAGNALESGRKSLVFSRFSSMSLVSDGFLSTLWSMFRATYR